MIRTLLALDGALIRGALAIVLSQQSDIDVVAELDQPEELTRVVRIVQPDIAVVDFGLFGVASPHYCERPFRLGAADAVPRPGRGVVTIPACPTLLLLDPRRPRAVDGLLRAHAATGAVGFLGNDVAPERVVEGVRRLFRGELVVDADLVVAALSQENPLTNREAEVLEIAAEGCPVKEIAGKLALSPGTVRNHLSRIAGKVGARTRIEAVRIAQDAGWI